MWPSKGMLTGRCSRLWMLWRADWREVIDMEGRSRRMAREFLLGVLSVVPLLSLLPLLPV